MALLIASGAGPASAAFIDGAITMGGDILPTGGTNLSDATGIDFLGDDFRVHDVTGDLSGGIAVDDIGVAQDFAFNPLSPLPVDPLWSVGGYSFRLESVNIEFQSSLFLLLYGNGTLSAPGFDDTVATLTLSANSAGPLFNFSAGIEADPLAVPVPLAGALMLFGSALTVLGWRRR